MTALGNVQRDERAMSIKMRKGDEREKASVQGASRRPDSIGRVEGLILRIVLPLMVLGAWWIASLGSGAASVLPSPITVFAALAKMMRSGQLFTDVSASLGRALAGFLIAATIGIFFGLLMSQSRLVRQILAGPMELLRPISSIAWIPLAILWFGIGFQSVVFVIVISCVFIILLNTLDAATRVDQDLIKAALTLGADRRLLFLKVVVPSAIPGIMLGLRIAMTGAWGGVLIAEMIATRNGIGYMMARAQASFHPEIVISGMVVVGVVGYILNALFVMLQRRVAHV